MNLSDNCMRAITHVSLRTVPMYVHLPNGALMVLGGIKQVYADVISEPALQLLMDAGVKTGYGKTVSHIINRTHTDWCPIEKATRDLATPQEILPAITEFLNQQRR